MSQGLETGGRLAARCRSPPAPDPREASREARLGGPATLGRPRAARSALEGPTAPRPLGREKPHPASAADAHSTRSPSSSSGAPASGAGQPASLLPPPGGWGRTRRRAVSAAPPGCAAKAEERPNGTAPASGTGAPGGLRADPRADPRPRRLSVQAATIQPAPHLISRRVRAAAPGTNQWNSLAEGRDAGAATPHTIPTRPPASPCVPEPSRDSPSRAAVLRSNQAALPPLSSALLYLLRSLPRSLSPAYLIISFGHLPRHHPPLPLRPQVGGDKQPANREKGPEPPHRPLSLAPPAAGTKGLEADKNGRGRSDNQ